MSPSEQTGVSDLFGSEDHLASEQVFQGDHASNPGDVCQVAGLTLILLDNGNWRVFSDVAVLQSDDQEEAEAAYLNTLNPRQFKSTNHVYDHLRGLAAYVENGENNDDTHPGAKDDTHTPGVH